MGKASTKKKQRVGRDGRSRGPGGRPVVNEGTRYLDWWADQPPAPHNCVIRPERPPYPGPAVLNRVEHGRCVRSDCARRWKATIGQPGRVHRSQVGHVIGWEPA